MLISPPFLPAPKTGESDADWIARAMPVPVDCAAGTYAPEGSFPVSSYMQWHNGVHCTAPVKDGHHLPVRAVADGTVVFVAQPAPHSEDPAHPLNYPLRTPDGWTDTGCVAVRHTTDIGAAGSVPTRITYFSLSMHLRTIADGTSDAKGKAAPWKAGDRIFRKDAIGEPGRIMGAEGRLHFEIFCDEANLQKILGRPVRWEDDEPFAVPEADGRTDAVFGSVFVYLPTTTPVLAADPVDPVRKAAASQMLDIPQWVEIRYDEGASHITGRDIAGQPVGTAPFTPLDVADFEYDMYTHATERHTAYVAKGGKHPSSPSGWYELLRFGRNLGPDPLPADAAHWRQIPTPQGNRWADLNAEGTFKFSEADFLPVMGWNCFGDDPTPDDQRCDSVELKRRIRDRDPENAQRMTREALCQRIAIPSVREKLRKSICQFPTEWDQSTVSKRYEWITNSSEIFEMDLPENWERFVRHCEALTFQDIPQELKQANWRLHPAEFVQVMRKCGWIAADELAQCIPRKSIFEKNMSWQSALIRAETHALHLNTYFRKYKGASRKRHAHALSQIYTETGIFRTVTEDGSGRNRPYAAFYGRGYNQLTWPENYAAYGKFRSLSEQIKPAYVDNRITAISTHSESGGKSFKWSPRFDPDIVASDLTHSAEASGLYWITKHFRGTSNINRACDLNFDPLIVAFVCWLINGGGNGHNSRQQAAKYIANILFDEEPVSGIIEFTYPPLKPAAKIPLCQKFPPIPVTFTEKEAVNHEKQRP